MQATMGKKKTERTVRATEAPPESGDSRGKTEPVRLGERVHALLTIAALHFHCSRGDVLEIQDCPLIPWLETIKEEYHRRELAKIEQKRNG